MLTTVCTNMTATTNGFYRVRPNDYSMVKIIKPIYHVRISESVESRGFNNNFSSIYRPSMISRINFGQCAVIYFL